MKQIRGSVGSDRGARRLKQEKPIRERHAPPSVLQARNRQMRRGF